MKQLVIRKNHHESFFIYCPLCFWALVTDKLSWLFAPLFLRGKSCGRLGNPVFAPRYMSLLSMAWLMLQQVPFVGNRKVHRSVCIPVKTHLIHVDVLVDAWIKDSNLLMALAVYNLCNSPELKKLPHWMAREIRRRSKHMHFVSTCRAYKVRFRCSVDEMATSEDCLAFAEKVIASIKLSSISHCLIWKGSFAVARNITAKGLAPKDYLRDNVGAVLELHPICIEVIARINRKSYWLSTSVAYVLINVAKWYPAFFYTTTGSRLLSAIYTSVGLYRILQKTVMEIRSLMRQELRFWRGSQTPLSLELAGKEEASECLTDLLGDTIPDNEIELLDGPVLVESDQLNYSSLDQENACSEDTRDSEDKAEDGAPSMPQNQDVSKGGHQEQPPTASGAFPEVEFDQLNRIGLDQEDASSEDTRGSEDKPEDGTPLMPLNQDASKGDYQEQPTKAPEFSHEVETAPQEPDVLKEGNGPAKEVEAADKTVATENLDAFQAMLSAAYIRATGAKKAPLFVINAAALDNSVKSGKQRKINRYRGQIPACSLEAMMQLIDTMYPGCYLTDYVPAKAKGDKDTVYLHTNSTEITCPCCGSINKKEKDGNTRVIEDIGFRYGVGAQLQVTMGRATCHNPECSKHGSCCVEECSFAHPTLKHSKRIQYLALVMATSSSFHDTERLMKLMGVFYGDDQVKSLVMSLRFRDEVDATIIGIDDVSVRKGHSYCTIIYNMQNGHMLKLIEGRGGHKFQTEFHNWLDQHPNVRIICRDRARAYGCYIDRYCLKHPDRKIIQVADRFHLLQNLSEHLDKAYRSKIPYQIALKGGKENPTILTEIPKKVYVPIASKTEGMDQWKYDNSPLLDSAGNPIQFNVYVDRMSENAKIARLDANKAKYEKICQVRKDYEACGRKIPRGKKEQFLKDHEISSSTFKNYISMSEEEIEELRHSWKPASRPKAFDKYQNLVYKMLLDGHSIPDVFWYIKDVVGGWLKGDSTLIEYIIETHKVVYPDEPLPLLEEYIRGEYKGGALVVNRQRVFYALMTLDEKKQDKALAPYLDKICETYPACKAVRDTFEEFHDIIIVDKKISDRTPVKCQEGIEGLHAFIEKHKDDELSAFANSLKSDIRCVSNAITMRESSGAVEGRNCKYKEFLRTAYGHIKLETLEQKLKLGFMYTSSDFSFDEIAPWFAQDMPI